MKFLKFLWRMLRLSCLILTIPGCVAALSTPVSVLPLVIVSLLIITSKNPAAHPFQNTWKSLTSVLLVQFSLFSMLCMGVATYGLEEIGDRFDFKHGILAGIANIKNRPFVWDRVSWALTMQPFLWAMALLPPTFLASLLWLWHRGWQTLAVALLLLPLLLLAITLILIFGALLLEK